MLRGIVRTGGRPPGRTWNGAPNDARASDAHTGLGERAAFALLYERTSAHTFAVVLRINRDRAEAEDVMQEVYVCAWRAARGFDAAQSQPLTWLTSIGRHRAIDSLRRRKAEPARQAMPSGEDDEDRDVVDTLPSDAPGPLALLGRAADARALAVCMALLSGPQRQCVALAFFDGLSHAEVAGQMRQPLGTVKKSWIRRALQALKGCLDGAVQRDRAVEPAPPAP